MAVVFQNKQVKKRDFYAWFIQEWKNAGWSDISSSATDGQVMYSKGADGTKNLFIAFRENSTDGIFSTSGDRMIDVRFPKWYSPNQTPNTVGISERSAVWWRICIISTTTIGLDATMSVWYYIDENYGAFIFEGNNGYNNSSHFFYVGNPHELKPETSNSGLIFMSTNAYPTADSMVYCVDDPYSVKTAEMTLSVYNTLPPRLKSTLDPKFCSDIVVGNTDGYRFQIDDSILMTGATNVIFTNDFMINGGRYRFFRTNAQLASWGNTFLNYNIGIRIG